MNAFVKRIVLPVAAGCGGVLLVALLARAADLAPAAVVEVAKAAAKQPAEPASTKGKIDEVTVYRGQALVTRLVDVPGPAGLREIVVSDLPERIEPASIYAESADGVEVRSVLYRIRPVERDVREEVRKLDDDIRQVQDQIQNNAEQAKVLGQQLAYMDKLQQFTAPTANAELTKGVLNAETLKSLTAFQFDQRSTIAAKQLKLTFELRDFNDKLNVLNRQREQLTGGSARTIREAVVFVQLKGDGGRMRLRYLVDGATWDPSYNVRVDGKKNGVTIEYNASIEQMSGEDWDSVAMTLSTATPSLVAKAPVLDPLTIALHSGLPPQMPAGAAGGKGYFSAKKDLDERRKQVEMTRNANPFGQNGSNFANGGGFGGGAQGAGQPQMPNASYTVNAQPGGPTQQQAVQIAQPAENFDETLNEVAQESQVLDLVSSAKVERASKPSVDVGTAGVTVSYQLAARTTLPSRSDRQLIQIAALPMKAEFYKLAEPVLTSYVYDEASVVNDGKTVLLAGPVSTYVAGQFVGHGDLPTVAIGESFTIGLGIDSSLRAHRELLKKNESIQGGNRLVEFTYQLALENFGADPATVRLLDRMPNAKESEVKLTLVEPGQKLSDDTRYEQQDRKKGLLRWDVKVPAQSIGPKMFTLDYQMQMEYDKQLSIASLPLTK
jgi:hypothetical protein